jgi:hypothetical protein
MINFFRTLWSEWFPPDPRTAQIIKLRSIGLEIQVELKQHLRVVK